MNPLQGEGDSLSIGRMAEELYRDLQKQGFLGANYSLEYQKERVLVFFELNNKYLLKSLDVVDTMALTKPTFWPSEGTTLRLRSLQRMAQSRLDFFVNHGFPLVAYRFDSVRIDDDQVSLSLRFSYGPLITYDSLLIPSEAGVSMRFMQAYLGMERGGMYAQREIEGMVDRIEQLPYVRIGNPPKVYFKNNKAYVQMDLQKVRVNELDFLLGFTPENGPEGRTLLTGQLNLQLHNLFNSGKYLGINWQRLKPRSQSLQAELRYPRVFSTPIDVVGRFHLLKEDTLFIQQRTQLDLGYAFRSRSSFEVSFSQHNATVLSVEEDIATLPDVIDSRTSFFEWGYAFASRKNVPAPRKGGAYSLKAGVGNRRIVRNTAVPQELYEGLDTQTNAYRLRGAATHYFSLSKQTVLMMRVQTEALLGSAFFKNEVYRLGGLQSLRGFTENYFFASRYALANLEYRFMFSDESFLYLLADQAYLALDIPQQYTVDWPRAFGVGMQLAVKGGNLKLAYALGQSASQKFGLNYSVVHFGFVSRF
ncbi:BamA/TamA family outer membrane protein [Cytophagales bacterium LB-30]|uniref:BamA/TamA family outer membrane protein n=1 Tax=Shiella aurantiaca TaxID=3058365 RepID=A0ABT8F7D3_9BACT|nr:BamA/TamA family outer membrane protein [Shiella aurantiaca]MDN4166154.1 BamA/TamA family outer membrane protein [Shiella aurantiaca]